MFMLIYLDSDFKCYTSKNENTILTVETDFFNGKCQSFIEGYRFVPQNEVWTNSNGDIFQGEMIAPWKNFDELDSTQRTYEQELIKEQEALIAELDAALLDATYNNLILAKMGE